MGYIYRIRCDKCNIDTTLNLGVGMRYTGNKNVAAYCPACRTYKVASVPMDSMGLEKTPQVTDIHCECGSTLILKPELESVSIENQEIIVCDSCGGNLKLSNAGLWD